MEYVFEFLFGAGGRINRAKYWRSVLVFIGTGLMTAVILFTAAGIATPMFLLAVVLVLIPWLLWGASFTTERLHDRDKSAWWLVVFYVAPGVPGQLAKAAWFAGGGGTVLHYILALMAFVPAVWGFFELGCLPGTAGSNAYGPDPLVRTKRSN
jgi:uncharacterized membrane protein YhaH (DUF805 family)